jgi:hypothetical protein
MKFAKLSIAAIAVLGLSSTAFAGGKSDITINPFGSAKLYYETIAHDGVAAKEDLFDTDGASGQALLSLGSTGKINSCFGYGFEAMAVNTLGLENNLVTDTRMGWGYHSSDGLGGLKDGNPNNKDRLDTQFWFPQAYVTYHPCDMGTNTTFKIGRQYLDTPLAFTEKWNIAPNSFDAVVAMNQDILNTTLVAAYVGRGNGEFARVTNGERFEDYGYGVDSEDSQITHASKLGKGGGAYALGAITSLLDGAIPLSIWGYDVSNIANAIWADAGYKLNLGGGMKLDLGAQYGAMMPDDDANSLVGANAEDSSGFGVKVGGGMSIADMNFGLTAAYSSIDDDGSLPLANTATGFKKTKLYTAGIYTDGTGVAVPGSDAFKVKATTKLAGIGGLAVQYVSCENDQTNSPMQNVDEIDVILSSGFLPGGLNTKLIYMNRDVDVPGEGGLAHDTDHVRVILSKKF